MDPDPYLYYVFIKDSMKVPEISSIYFMFDNDLPTIQKYIFFKGQRKARKNSDP